MIDYRTAAVIAGGGIGAYTSDVTDNPLTGTLSTAIGMGIGGLMVLPRGDIKNMMEAYNGLSQDRVGIVKNSLNHTSDLVTKHQEKVANLISLWDDDITNPVSPQFRHNLREIHSILAKAQTGVPDVTDIDGILDRLSKIDDENLLKHIKPLLDVDIGKDVINTYGVTVPTVQSQSFKLDGSLSEAEKISRLSDYFEKTLNNSAASAQEKAQMIVGRATGSIQIKNGSAIFQDVADNKAVNVPLTSYDTNGVRYHDAGGGKALSVKGFSPYAMSYVDDVPVNINGVDVKPTINQVTQGMDPEMMLKYLGKDTPLSTLIPKVKSLMQFNSEEVAPEVYGGGKFTATSPTFINNSHLVSLDQVFNVDRVTNRPNEEQPFRKLKTEAKGLGQVSELTRVRKVLSEDYAQATSMMIGVSGNSLTDIQTLPLQTISALAPMERNVMGGALRDSLPAHSTMGTSALHNTFAPNLSKLNYASAQVIGKLDIKDANTFNQISAMVSGDNSVVLADGFGLYNQKHGAAFSNKTTVTIGIPRNSKTIISNPELVEAFRSPDFNAHIAANPIQLPSNTPFAYNDKGEPLQLGKQYTHGNITNMFLDIESNKLMLQMDAIVDATQTSQVKLFSPGSKALMGSVQERTFNTLAVLGSLLNTESIRLEGGKVYSNTARLDKFIPATGLDQAGLQGLINDVNFQSVRDVSGVSMILDAENTGSSGLLNNSYKGIVDTNNPILKHLDATQTPSGNTGIAKATHKASMLITAELLREQKASEDLTAHVNAKLLAPLQRLLRDKATGTNDFTVIDKQQVTQYIRNGLVSQDVLDTNVTTQLIKQSMDQVSGAFRSAVETKTALSFNKDQTEALFNLVRMSGTAMDVVEGKLSAIGATGRDEAIVGAGNRARMSWNAYSNLLISGYSREQAKLFGKLDEKKIYELEGYLSESSRSKYSINSFIGQVGRSDILDILDATPEERIKRMVDRLGGAFQAENHPYLGYNLHYQGSEIKSLAFGIMSTNRQGKYAFGDTEINKQFDKLRLSIMDLDMQYKGATGSRKKELEAELKTTMQAYEALHTSTTKGANSIVKQTLSLYSDTSQIAVANPIGGQAKEFIESIERDPTKKSIKGKTSYKAIADNAFVSTKGAEAMAQQLGVKLEFVDIDGFDQLKRAMYRDKAGNLVPLSALVTREPAQGLLSVDFLDLVVDTTIKKGNNKIFFADGQAAWALAKAADFDQDTAQVLYRNLSKEQYDDLRQSSTIVRNAYAKHLDTEVQMNPKGGTKSEVYVTDFADESELAKYMVAADSKGKARKLQSPNATILATKFNHALQREFGIEDIDSFVKQRMGTYRSIENLLKSAHLDTKSFMNDSQPIEEIVLARKAYMDGKPVKQYEDMLNKHLPSILGYDADLPNTLDPVKFQGADRAKVLAANEDILKLSQDIIKADLNHAKDIEKSFLTPLDVDKVNGVKGLHDSIKAVAEGHGLLDVEKSINGASPARLYENLNNVIVEGFRNNKALVLGGIGAMVGVNLLGRESPQFTDSREEHKLRQHSSKMLQAPRRDLDSISTDMPTSTGRTGYVQPNHQSNQVDVTGEFINTAGEGYNQFNSMIDNLSPGQHDLNTAVFGNNLRSLSLITEI